MPHTHDPADAGLRITAVSAMCGLSVHAIRAWERRYGVPGPAVLQNLRAAEVRQALKQLPAEQRGVIQLGYFAGMRSVDIARSLSLPEGTVRSGMRLGLGKLRAILGNTTGVAAS